MEARNHQFSLVPALRDKKRLEQRDYLADRRGIRLRKLATIFQTELKLKYVLVRKVGRKSNSEEPPTYTSSAHLAILSGSGK